MKKVRFWGLDVRAETIAIAVAEDLDCLIDSLGLFRRGGGGTEGDDDRCESNCFR
jgi:hypothetical protein